MKKILLLTSIFSLNMLMASQVYSSKPKPNADAKRITKLEKTLEATLAKATKLESELQSLQESIVSEGEALEEVLGSAEAAKLTAKKTTLKPYQSKSTPTAGAINTAKRKAAAAESRAAAAESKERGEGEEAGEAAKLTAKKTTLKPYQSKSTPTPGAINTAKRKAAAAALRAAAEGEEY